MSGAMVTVVIAEDEPHAREGLRSMLDDVPWLEVVGEAADGVSAVELVDRHRPEVLFLDVEMPGLTGLEVLERIRHQPTVVFTTAYQRYAVTAFELEAVDYLVKPFGRRRLLATLDRVRRSLAGAVADGGQAERARSALDEAPLRRLFARLGDVIHPLSVSAIVRLEARGDYVEAVTEERSYLLHVSLAALVKRLDATVFLRVHRAHVVNLDRVVRIREYGDRRLVLDMADGTAVLASRGGSARVRAMVR